MINQLPDLEKEDKRYNLHVGAEAPTTYNLSLVFPDWSATGKTVLNNEKSIQLKNDLVKLGIFLK